MMQVRCQHCRGMFTLSRDGIGLALAEAQAKNEQYHAFNCPQCRYVVKLQITELRRHLPADYVLPEWTPPPPAAEPVPVEKPPEENAAPAEPARPKRAPRLTPSKSRRPKSKK